MLKPTVGMELWPLALGPTVMMVVLVAAQRSAGGMLLSARLGASVDVLDSELASLESACQPDVFTAFWWMQRGYFLIWELLTARTLNSDVLPAFCRPIMVMSISVALQFSHNQHAS